jgi:competence protein ComEA
MKPSKPAAPAVTRIARGLLLTFLLAGSAFAQEKVNINTADASSLERVLLNVGPAKADAIVAYRKANGAFKSADQLAQVPGIGLKTVERNKDRILVGGAPPARPQARPGAVPAQKAPPAKR